MVTAPGSTLELLPPVPVALYHAWRVLGLAEFDHHLTPTPETCAALDEAGARVDAITRQWEAERND